MKIRKIRFVRERKLANHYSKSKGWIMFSGCYPVNSPDYVPGPSLITMSVSYEGSYDS